IAGRVFTTGEPVVANNIEDAKAQADWGDSGFFVSAPLVCRPLRAADRIVGVLNITDRCGQSPFSPAELESIDLLCNIAPSAVTDFLARETLDNAQDAIVVALATLAEYRDLDTGKHLDRVTRFAVMIAEELAKLQQFSKIIDEAFVRDLKRAIPLHDIGKVGVP